MTWTDTGRVDPEQLEDARLQIHYGALVLASAAHSLIEHAPDDSHSNLGFCPIHDALSTRAFPSGEALELRLESFELVVRTEMDEIGVLPLDGRTLGEAIEWVGAILTSRGASITEREYPDFPVSPIGSGGPFAKPSVESLGELGAWFGNALALFAELGSAEPTMSPSRVWPHHFDLGALIPLSDDGQVTIGIGLSPGDEHFDAPYFYCSPYPAPTGGAELPELKAGHWQTEGFTSAILTARDVQTAASQEAAARAYLESAVGGCRQLLRSAQ